MFLLQSSVNWTHSLSLLSHIYGVLLRFERFLVQCHFEATQTCKNRGGQTQSLWRSIHSYQGLFLLCRKKIKVRYTATNKIFPRKFDLTLKEPLFWGECSSKSQLVHIWGQKPGWPWWNPNRPPNFPKIAIRVSSLEIHFGCAFSISDTIRAIFWTWKLKFDDI